MARCFVPKHPALGRIFGVLAFGRLAGFRCCKRFVIVSTCQPTLNQVWLNELWDIRAGNSKAVTKYAMAQIPRITPVCFDRLQMIPAGALLRGHTTAAANTFEKRFSNETEPTKAYRSCIR